MGAPLGLMAKPGKIATVPRNESHVSASAALTGCFQQARWPSAVASYQRNWNYMRTRAQIAL